MLSQDAGDPWPKSDLLEPAQLAQQIQSAKAAIIICVAFPVLYRSKHILHAVGSRTRIQARRYSTHLKRRCETAQGCGHRDLLRLLPDGECPNIRPAYSALKETGFTRIRVLDIATNMHTDWYEKNYPSEAGTEQK